MSPQQWECLQQWGNVHNSGGNVRDSGGDVCNRGEVSATVGKLNMSLCVKNKIKNE